MSEPTDANIVAAAAGRRRSRWRLPALHARTGLRDDGGSGTRMTQGCFPIGSVDGTVLLLAPRLLAGIGFSGLIGEGGMGAVYEAEQDHPRRTVALKIIKPGMASPELLRRFEQESQALGRLQHPGIAQIYEAGTVDTGFGPQPYFAMEFIRGKTLQDYAEAHHLNSRHRLGDDGRRSAMPFTTRISVD